MNTKCSHEYRCWQLYYKPTNTTFALPDEHVRAPGLFHSSRG